MGAIPMFVAMMERKAAPGGILTSFYSRRYNKVIRKEISLGEITGNDSVLNIGCGGIPYTALQIASATGARVWAIDNNNEAVTTAQKCISTVKMEDRVTALHLDGRDNFPFPFNVAVVALQAEPKKEILENLLRQAEPGARIIFRNPRPKFRQQYDSLPVTPPFSNMVIQNKATFDSSVLYRKVAKENPKENLFSLTNKIAVNQ